ncbi:hypothetical protein H8711_01570 [Clostridiaceae bacterium NSJ-31]|uniref:Uncharacterized protein n=1 Tax=Ligaoa zhengdingensis TaxID=2763658 RepID=A0A926DVS8_9FIRM|nr:hypothetical protein [Ligaoa zhengdingensis]MBC8545626.1 hypothetical protein [Ligaoa zhengdingensis]
MKNNSNMPNLSQGQIDLLLRMASQKMGVAPDKLKAQLQRGELPQGVNTANVQQILNDPKRLEELLNSDRAKRTLQSLMNNNG